MDKKVASWHLAIPCLLLGLVLHSQTALAQCRIASTTIDTPAQATSVKACKTFTGNIVITRSNSTTDTSPIDLDGLEEIQGNLKVIAPPTGITVYSSTLRNISRWFEVVAESGVGPPLASLNLTFPKLAYMGDWFFSTKLIPYITFQEGAVIQNNLKVDETDAGVLTTTSFSNITNSASYSMVVSDNRKMYSFTCPVTNTRSVYVYRNTALSRLEFPTLRQVNGTLEIYQNPALAEIDLSPSWINRCEIYLNSHNAKLTLKNLTSIGTLFINGGLKLQNLASISLPVLRQIFGSLGVSYNTVEDFELFTLENTTAEARINSNPNLVTLSLPRLQNVGDVIIDTNPKLLNVTANSLITAKSITMTGNFTNVEFFALKQITGDFKLKGALSMDCSWFDENFFQKVVKGSYQCDGNHTKPAEPRRPSTSNLSNPSPIPSPSPSPTGEPSSSSSSGLSTGAKAGIGAGVAVGALLFIVAALLYLRRRKSKVEVSTTQDTPVNPVPELHGEAPKPHELPDEKDAKVASTLETPVELSSDLRPNELPVSSKPVELP